MNTSLLRILGLGLSLLWATTGCRHTGPEFTTDAAIEVTPNIDPAQQAAATRTATTAGASKTGFGATDEFGVWVVPYLNSDVSDDSTHLLAAKWEPKDNYADNVLFVSKDGKFAPQVGSVYYPSPKTLVDLYGVYPYNATMSNQEADPANNSMPNPAAFAFSIAQNQTLATSVVASDLMTSKAPQAQQGKVIAMAFIHRLSRVLIAFEVPEQYLNKNVTGVSKVEVCNIPLKAVVDLSDTTNHASAATTTNAPVDILAHKAISPTHPTATGDYVYEAIVMPGTVVASGTNIVRITLTVETLGEVVFECKYLHKKGEPHTYEAMKLTQINVTIGAETTIELDKDQVTIAQWGKMTEIAGSTSKLSKMWFAYEDAGNAWADALKCDAATLVIEGDTFQATKVQYVAGAGAFLIEYDHGTNAGGYLEQITLQTTDKATILLNVVLKSDIDQKSRGYQIKGDPTMSNYDKKIGKITVTGANTAKVDPITE